MQDARTRLEAILGERIAVLDGSWGVLIQREVKGEEAYRGERFKDHPRDVAGDPDLLNLTRPEVVLGIHRDYFAAGADIATTNTFTATTIGQADYGLEDHAYEMNVAGAKLARQAADEVGGFVAGSVGPLNVTLSLSPRVDDPAFRTHTFDQVYDTYADQIRGLAEGGVDFLLIETIFDTLNAKAAIAAALDVAPQLPLWISFTAIDRSGRNLSGQTVDAFWSSTPSRSSSGSTARSARRRCGRSWKTSRASLPRGWRATRMRAFRTRWARMTSSPRTRARRCARSPRTGW
jgi:5-methyltetrahydrofolate--homocysteine methyltransferase